ncbi:MAG TPA: ATP-binding cassette domain-containing protein [Candidatus Dormibacteraeota bacterium]
MISEIRAEGVRVVIGSRTILDGVDLEVRAGEVVAVTGPSGSGKTTLMMVLAGLQATEGGRVLLDGEPMVAAEGAENRVGIVLQNHGLVSILTAAENVSLPLQARRVAPDQIAARTKDALHSVGLDDASGHLAEDLSGGQRQRVGVARALASDPELLIADEPTSELGAEARHQVLALLRRHADRGRIVVLASHDTEVVAACDRCLRLLDGRPATA